MTWVQRADTFWRSQQSMRSAHSASVRGRPGRESSAGAAPRRWGLQCRGTDVGGRTRMGVEASAIAGQHSLSQHKWRPH